MLSVWLRKKAEGLVVQLRRGDPGPKEGYEGELTRGEEK